MYEFRMSQHATLLAIHLTEINIRQKDMKIYHEFMVP